MICVKDLLELNSFQNLKPVSGDAGLNRKVSWPNIAQTVSIKEWLVGGDVILMTGIGMEITVELLNDIVKQAADGKAACLIILKHEQHIPEIPKETIDYAVSRDFPVFEAPWETKLSNVIMDISSMVYNDQYSQIIKNEFMEKLILGKINLEDDYNKKQLEYYGLFEEHTVVIIHFDNRRELEGHGKEAGSPPLERPDAYLYGEMQVHFRRCLYINHEDEMIFLLKSNAERMGFLKEYLQKLYLQTSSEFPKMKISIGIGNTAKTPEHLTESYEQARKALLVKKEIPVISYEDLGIYQLLLEIPDKEIIRKYVDKYLGTLLEYDKKYEQELTLTLQIFLRQNGNIAAAAKELFVHRNTMLKRLEKIEELLNLSLKSAEVRNIYYNCFVLKEFME